MKILVINKHQADAMGGSEIQCDIIARSLGKRGHDILYLAVKGKRDSYGTPYRVRTWDTDPGELETVCGEFSPDLVYWRYNKVRLRRSIRVFKRLGIPVVLGISHIRDVRRMYMEKIKLNSLRNAVKVPAVFYRFLVNFYNHGAYRDLAGAVCLNPEYMDMIPCERKIFIPDIMEEEAVEFNWERDFCLWVANIKPRKNPEKYIELARALEKSGVDFLMAGGIQSASCEWIRKSSGHPGNFHYLGPRTLKEVNGMLEKSLFLVHTCDPEGFGDNFIQAWLKGKPAVSLYFDPAGYLEKEKIGFCPGNTEGFVKDTERLIENPGLRREMGERAGEFARRVFDPEMNTGKLEEFLNKLSNLRGAESQS